MGFKKPKIKVKIPTAKDIGRAVEKAAHDVGRTAEKAGQDVGHTAEKAAHDIGHTLEKAAQDTGEETKRAGRNVNRAAIAAGHFLENQVHAYGHTLTDAERRIREGKLVDAIWHAATDPARHTEDNFAKAVTESSLLNNIAQAAASVYGGPAAAAAYAAWYVYKRTGNLCSALKAGVIAGAVAEGCAVVGDMPSGTVSELTKKTLASASIGGAAVAASGGEADDIRDAFFKGAAFSLAREFYEKTTASELDGKAPTKDAVPKDDPSIKHQFRVLTDSEGQPILDSEGNTQIDIRSMPKDISHVGLQTDRTKASFFSGAETSAPMQALAKVPYLNALAYFHDQWAAVAQMEGMEVQITIVPASILTASGSDTPLVNQSTKEAIESQKK
jgi:hypothetical protein